MKSTLPYALRQLLWMLKSSLQLMVLMSTGFLWVQQMLRLYIFAGCVWVFFIPHWWWYLTSANIIRRVAYRSSQTTRQRNLQRVLAMEGVTDLADLLRQGQRQQRRAQVRASASPAGVGPQRRRPPRPMAGPRHHPSARAALPLAGSSDVAGAASPPPPARRPPPPPRLPPGSPALTAHHPTSAGVADRAALDRLRRASERLSSVNPADGSILRSLPRSARVSPAAEGRSSAAAMTTTAAAAASSGSSGTGQAHTVPPPPPPPRQQQQQQCGVRVGCVSAVEDRDGDVADNLAAELLYTDPQFEELLRAFPRRGPPATEARLGSTGAGTAQRVGSSATPQQQQQSQPPRRVPAVSEEDEDEEDRLNLHNRATVDIVLPVPLDSLMKSMDYAKRGNLRRKKFPIVIDVSGGAWIIGSYLWSTMLARVLAARGYVVFCPDYRNFPQTTMEGMTLDVSDAIAWVLKNAERYNGDLNDVTLLGHSAGAHLTMMSLLSQAHLHAYEAYRGSAHDGLSVPAPSDVAYNVPRYHPRRSIHRYVGLSGIYNVERLVTHLHRRGLNAPVLQKIAGGKGQLARYSIHAYFDRRRGGDTGEVLPDNFFDFMPPRMFFLHGDRDAAAPVTESSSMVGVLRQAQMEFALRRLTRNEESRRHAHRSRDLLPGALTSTEHPRVSSGADGARADSGSGRDGSEGPLSDAAGDGLEEGGEESRRPGRRPPPALAPIVPPSRSDLPLRAVDLEFILIPDATHTDTIIEECIVGHRSCCADFICDYLTDSDGPAMVGSPVVLLSSGGGWRPRGSTDMASSHTPITHGLPLGGGGAALPGGGGSSISTTFAGASATESGSGLLLAPEAGGGAGAVTVDDDYVRECMQRAGRWGRTVDYCVPPDGLLPLAVPPEDRPRLLKAVMYFCPF